MAVSSWLILRPSRKQMANGLHLHDHQQHQQSMRASTSLRCFPNGSTSGGSTKLSAKTKSMFRLLLRWSLIRLVLRLVPHVTPLCPRESLWPLPLTVQPMPDSPHTHSCDVGRRVGRQMAAAEASQIEPGRAWRSKVRRVDLTEMVARAKRKSDAAAAALARTLHTHTDTETQTHAKGRVKSVSGLVNGATDFNRMKGEEG
jgi:hypothetical protein